MKITYAITVCTEHLELFRLLETLTPGLHDDDQVLIQYDGVRVTPEVMSVIEQYQAPSGVTYTVNNVPLDIEDFAWYKNHIFYSAKGDWIFQIDADEFPGDGLVNDLHEILSMNNGLDVLLVPRINTVDGLTLDHVKQWNWGISKINNDFFVKSKYSHEMTPGELELLRHHDLIISHDWWDEENQISVMTYRQPIINFPDYQWRLYKNKPDIRWSGAVHERLTGFNAYSNLPGDFEYCLFHPKDIKRQESQNARYAKI